SNPSSPATKRPAKAGLFLAGDADLKRTPGVRQAREACAGQTSASSTGPVGPSGVAASNPSSPAIVWQGFREIETLFLGNNSCFGQNYYRIGVVVLGLRLVQKRRSA